MAGWLLDEGMMANIRRVRKSQKESGRRGYLKKAVRKYGYQKVISALEKTLRRNPEIRPTIKQDLNWLRRRNPLLDTSRICHHCLGRGLVFSGVCSVCLGDGFIQTRNKTRKNPCLACSRGGFRRNPCGACGNSGFAPNGFQPMLGRNPIELYNPLDQRADYNPFPEDAVEAAIRARRNPFRWS